ncbi:glutaredoxin family protein [Candidatus Saccharibacteria bacterium]|nr:glutaredoxin family protein [Candidatus Saccharibacteria bacterium]
MIKVYSSDSCVYCDALMNWFDEEGIKYEYHHASEDPSIRSVPVTRIDLSDGSVAEIVGFDRPAIKKALKKIAG